MNTNSQFTRILIGAVAVLILGSVGWVSLDNMTSLNDLEVSLLSLGARLENEEGNVESISPINENVFAQESADDDSGQAGESNLAAASENGEDDVNNDDSENNVSESE